MSLRTVSGVVVVVAALSSCNQLFIEGHVSALCQHLTAQSFQVPRTATALSNNVRTSMSKGFAFDVSLELPNELKSAELDVQLTSLSMKAVEETTDFSFIERATVTLETPPDSNLAPHTVVAFESNKAAVNPRSISFASDGFNVAPYLLSGVMSYTVALTGTLPKASINADIDACAQVSLMYRYAETSP